MRLTPDIMHATYEWLRAIPPIRRWRLPHADDVVFRVTRKRDEFGSVCICEGQWEFDVSIMKVGHTETLLKTMLHEMAHMRTQMEGGGLGHGRMWQHNVASICRHHGFDPKEL